VKGDVLTLMHFMASGLVMCMRYIPMITKKKKKKKLKTTKLPAKEHVIWPQIKRLQIFIMHMLKCVRALP